MEGQNNGLNECLSCKVPTSRLRLQFRQRERMGDQRHLGYHIQLSVGCHPREWTEVRYQLYVYFEAWAG